MKTIPVCSSCRRVRLATGHWMRRFVGTFANERTHWIKDPPLSHGICPDCIRKEYPDYAEHILAQIAKEAVV